MSDDELQRLRQKKLAELQRQHEMQQNMQDQAEMAQQQAQFEAQKQYLLAQILSSDARSRLTNIRLSRPQYADMIELQLLQAYQSGILKGKIPLTDDQFKSLLQQLQNSQKRESKVKF